MWPGRILSEIMCYYIHTWHHGHRIGQGLEALAEGEYEWLNKPSRRYFVAKKLGNIPRG